MALARIVKSCCFTAFQQPGRFLKGSCTGVDTGKHKYGVRLVRAVVKEVHPNKSVLSDFITRQRIGVDEWLRVPFVEKPVLPALAQQVVGVNMVSRGICTLVPTPTHVGVNMVSRGTLVPTPTHVGVNMVSRGMCTLVPTPTHELEVKGLLTDPFAHCKATCRFTMALSWPYSFKRIKDDEYIGGRKFTLHGLWPDYWQDDDQSRKIRQWTRYDLEKFGKKNSELILDVWPNLEKPNSHDAAMHILALEWSRHGKKCHMKMPFYFIYALAIMKGLLQRCPRLDLMVDTDLGRMQARHVIRSNLTCLTLFGQPVTTDHHGEYPELNLSEPRTTVGASPLLIREVRIIFERYVEDGRVKWKIIPPRSLYTGTIMGNVFMPNGECTVRLPGSL